MEAFADVTTFDQNVVSYLELLRLPYTGCNPRGLILARDKALSKKLLAYHRIPVPGFTVVRPRPQAGAAEAAALPADREVAVLRGVGRHLAGVGRRERRAAGAARAASSTRTSAPPPSSSSSSTAASSTSACSATSGSRCFPVWEMSFAQDAGEPLADRHRAGEVEHAVPEEARHHDRRGARSTPPPTDRIQRIAKRAYRALDLNGYARIDLRHGRRGPVVRARSQPQPQPRLRRRLRRVGRGQRHPYERLLERIIRWACAGSRRGPASQ